MAGGREDFPMEVKLAERMGFCFGVKRAVDTVYEQIKNGKNIYTYGPIVNNEEVVRELTDMGVRVLESKEELTGLSSGSVIIRAHGVPEEICRILEERKLECIDATCPFVKRIHHIVEKESGAGRRIVIVGNAGHPEVEGIMGWCRGPVTVLKDPSEAENFAVPEGEKICVVAQTTYNYNKFHNVVEILGKKGYNSIVVNTICNATEERQRSARTLAAEADVMIVIGGKHSSNTRKLYEICKEECAHTYFIQTLDDLHLELPKSVRRVGITAGASTPNKLIEEVQNYVRINF
jgi:4-hydroxy-3-methylbut-2-enyl diphosphate reductase